MRISREFLDHLIRIVGESAVKAEEAVHRLDPGVDPQNLQAALLARPASAQEVARVLALCARFEVGVVPHGGRTGLAGGARSRAGELILSLDRLNRIEAISAAARTVTVESGVPLVELQSALAPHALSAGIDLGARDSATIGGMVATNAGGSEAFRYGTMRERVLGLEVAMASGEIFSSLSAVRKDNAGLPLRQLFIGSEGTLGIITRIVLQAVPLSPPPVSVLAVVEDLNQAVALMRCVESAPRLILRGAELMSGNHIALTAQALDISQLTHFPPQGFGLLLSVTAAVGDTEATVHEVLASAGEQGLYADCVLPKNVAEERDLWRIREDWAVDRIYPGGLWFDVSVPIDRLQDYVQQLRHRLQRVDERVGLFIIGHLADGNLHVTVNAAAPITKRYEEFAPFIYEGLKAMGGSFSAEHGIGLEKRSALEDWAGETGMRLMRGIKSLLDPQGIMNPGKVLKHHPP